MLGDNCLRWAVEVCPQASHSPVGTPWELCAIVLGRKTSKFPVRMSRTSVPGNLVHVLATCVPSCGTSNHERI